MKQKVLQTLEYTKIIAQLEGFASSSLAIDRCRHLIPMSSFDEVQFAQKETDEAVTVYRLKGHVPLGGIFDIRAHVKRATIGGILSPIEIMEIGSVLRVSRTLIKFFDGMMDANVELPILFGYRNSLDYITDLEKMISMAVDESGEVLDSASENLRQLRHRIRSEETRIREKLESIVRSNNAQKMLSDAIVTIRNDRFVIPVKAEYRSHYGGIVHDQSASGQTLFIEPQSILQMNNNLQDLKVKEQVEIEKILYQLTEKVAENADTLLADNDTLGAIDFACTKAKYSRSIKGSMPVINDKGIIKLKKVRHPLIPRESVVANDISIGDGYSTVVITGPNTGGKTVILKTIGICTLMAMAGLQIPALDGSHVSVFQNVFADIGDEQSIEQNLSTFSSHMTNIVEILQELDHQSLVLFDELGAGTDPGEGAALAISILDEAKTRGALVMATTHYPELKAYGYNRENVLNASMEFDVETLSPTFKLLLGIPGKSNAFEISKKLGLNERVINNARKMIGADTHAVENMIFALEKARDQAEKDRAEAAEFLQSAEIIKSDLQKEQIAYLDKKEDLIEKAELEATKIVNKAKQEADGIIRELRNMRLNRKVDVKESELVDVKKQLESAKPKRESKTQLPKKKKVQYFVGDEVRVLSFNQRGSILDKAGEGEWMVQLGIMKMKVSESDLEKAEETKKPITIRNTTVRTVNRTTSFRIDLHGERYEEAMIKLEKFIDDALLENYPSVEIIHGHGTGALRQGVQEFLKRHRSIKSFRFGAYNEGGMGITIAEFK
ncbi:MAG: endonuclease MutS2 [Bacillales bacterium]|nr:endonuclease MutS2 [Bacillales bacterium]